MSSASRLPMRTTSRNAAARSRGRWCWPSPLAPCACSKDRSSCGWTTKWTAEAMTTPVPVPEPATGGEARQRGFRQEAAPSSTAAKASSPVFDRGGKQRHGRWRQRSDDGNNSVPMAATIFPTGARSARRAGGFRGRHHHVGGRTLQPDDLAARPKGSSQGRGQRRDDIPRRNGDERLQYHRRHCRGPISPRKSSCWARTSIRIRAPPARPTTRPAARR